MKALLCTRLGPPESLVLTEGLPSPKPSVGEVKLQILVAGINFPDTLIIEGKYQFKPDLPFAPGPMELDTLTPSRANDSRFVMRFASYLRQSASPGAAAALLRYNTDVDSRAALAHVAAPALVLHRTADRDAKIDEGRFIARHIAGAQFVELAGADHWPFVGDSAALLGEVNRFLERLPSLPRRPGRRMPKPPPKPPVMSTLTSRQRQILELLAQGRSNREIAQVLTRSEHTVHRHVANILAQLGVRTRAQAVAILVR